MGRAGLFFGFIVASNSFAQENCAVAVIQKIEATGFPAAEKTTELAEVLCALNREGAAGNMTVYRGTRRMGGVSFGGEKKNPQGPPKRPPTPGTQVFQYTGKKRKDLKDGEVKYALDFKVHYSDGNTRSRFVGGAARVAWDINSTWRVEGSVAGDSQRDNEGRKHKLAVGQSILYYSSDDFAVCNMTTWKQDKGKDIKSDFATYLGPQYRLFGNKTHDLWAKAYLGFRNEDTYSGDKADELPLYIAAAYRIHLGSKWTADLEGAYRAPMYSSETHKLADFSDSNLYGRLRLERRDFLLGGSFFVECLVDYDREPNAGADEKTDLSIMAGISFGN